MIWTTLKERPGQTGFNKDKIAKERDSKYGKGNWRQAWTYQGKILNKLETFLVCEEAYFQDSLKREEIWQRLIAEAKDIYDMLPEEIKSGTDYGIQHKFTRFHDIAIRRVLEKRGWKFQGDKIIQIRYEAKKPDWYSENFDPGKVEFHQPELIVTPYLEGFWLPDTIECFYQSNKVLQIKEP